MLPRLVLRLLFFACAFFPGAVGAWAEATPGAPAENPAPLTRVADVFTVPRDSDDISVPVDIIGVVTFTGEEGASFFIHDGECGIHVFQPQGYSVEVGERVEVIGATRRGRYAPSVVPRKIVRFGHAPLPSPQPAIFSQIASGSLDSQWIAVSGVVSAVAALPNGRELAVDVTQADAGRVHAVVVAPLPSRPESLLDSEVRLCGVATGRFNDRGQMIEPIVLVPGIASITVTQPGAADPFAVPSRPVARLTEFSANGQPQHRIKVTGHVTRQLSDRIFFLRSGGRGLKVETHAAVTLGAGDTIEAAGFPAVANDEVILDNAVTRTIGKAPPPVAIPTELTELGSGAHVSDLVRSSARLAEWVADGPTVTMILEARNRLFKAVMPRPPSTDLLPSKGSLVDFTGICAPAGRDAVWLRPPHAFLLLVASPADMKVLQSPPWWTAQRLQRALALAVVLLGGGAAWVFSLRRQVRHTRAVLEFQARHAAVLEERSRIARELHDTLEQGLTGVSLQFKALENDLHDAPERAATRLASAREMLRQSRAVARNAIRELRDAPHRLVSAGLIAALRDMASLWNHSGTVTIAVEVMGESQRLAEGVEHHLFNIAAEAITNAIKHGRATSVTVNVGYGEAFVALTVIDNGSGFDPGRLPALGKGRFGIVGMQERAAELAGRFAAESAPGEGTTIKVEVPISHSPRDSRGSQKLVGT